MKRNFFETIVGFFVLAIAGLFLYFSYISSFATKGQFYTLNARFGRVDGLSVGNDVKIGGVRIGSVTTIDIDPTNYQAMVQFSVRQDIKLPADSSAEIASDGLLGGKFLHLTPGGDEVDLKNNERIMYTQSAVNLESLVSKFMFGSGANSGNDAVT